ncbi:MAG: thiamine/thiamine pyrophosphate ABC transporter permease [Rhodospirillaceae bacterium]|nr:thiamine/thiamine pyrophosphate ABC transporter permease [Rhodospirillaceae bacterium]
MAARAERLATGSTGRAIPGAAWPGLLLAAAMAGLVVAAFASLLGEVDRASAVAALGDSYLWRVVRFTLLQAGLSTLVSLVPAVLLARALARRPRFPGRALLVRLLGLPMVIPVIVSVFGIVAIFGQAGIANRIGAMLGLEQRTFLYGLTGILIGHAFLNLPLATRLLLPAWTSVPGETWRLAAQLGMRSGAIFRLIEWPLLRERLPGVVAVVFMLCTTSFAVVLTLGGGPAATTIEVAIYQALRFDFDPSRASLLALIQLGLSIVVLVAAQRWTRPFDLLAAPGRPADRPDRGGAPGMIMDSAVILVAALFLLLPLSAIVAAGMAWDAFAIWGDVRLWQAAARSLVVALAAGTLSVVIALALQISIRRLAARGAIAAGRALDLAGSIVLGLSPLAVGAGLFLLLVGLVGPFRWSLAPVVLLTALLALPYAMRLIGPPLAQSAAIHDRLCASLGLAGWNRWRLVEWPQLRPSIGFALALAVTLALGDLAAIALFGTPQNATLPLLLYQLLAGYRMGEAAGVALFLVLLVMLLFVGIERSVGGRRLVRH